MQLKSNTELQGGKYRIIRVIGQGGFGITYLAENIYLNKFVAIKEFFPKEFCGRDNTSHVTLGTVNNAETVAKLKARFLKEAQNIAKLDHTGIVKIHDIFEENETAYYVMDYIDGENLNEMVKRNGPLPESKALEYIRKVADALDYIHSRNMTHFDVKPANIVVRKSDDMPILIDFGLSKQYDRSGDATSTMMQGVSQGYSPIELYSINSILTFSPQTDVYSLGATLYYLLTGTVPPSASQIIEAGIQLPSYITSNISAALQCAMSANRTKRYKTVKDLCHALLDDTQNNDITNIDNGITSEESVGHPIEDTQLIDNTSKQQIEDPSAIDSVNASSYEEQESDYEEEPSRWERFVNWICGTENLINANQIPIAKKIAYILLLFLLIVSAALFPILGWLFLYATYKYIRNSLQRLIFADYLHEWDDAYDYSKGKAITIVSLVICIPVIWIVSILSISKSNTKKEVAEYVSGMSATCPFNLFDVQVSSFSYVDGDIIVTLHSSDSIHSNRDDLNQYNVDLWKPFFIDENLPHYNIAKNNNITFKFYNNGQEMKSIVMTPKEINNYKDLPSEAQGRELISSFMKLENTYLPYDLGANVKMTRVSIENLGTNTGDYLTFTFIDDDRIIEKEFGDSINNNIARFIPLNLPYLAESVANSIQGIGYSIRTHSGNRKEEILYTSSDLKDLLSQH